MEEHEGYKEKICDFKRYVKQTMDLMVDSYKWKTMAEYSDNEMMKQKYKKISDELFEMFMEEHNNIGKMFKSE